MISRLSRDQRPFGPVLGLASPAIGVPANYSRYTSRAAAPVAVDGEREEHLVETARLLKQEIETPGGDIQNAKNTWTFSSAVQQPIAQV